MSYGKAECSNGHVYPLPNRWCPTCGELRDPKKPSWMKDSQWARMIAGKKYTTLQIWKVTKVLRRRFRAACNHNKTTMRTEILAFMERYSKATLDYKADFADLVPPGVPEASPEEASAAAGGHRRGDHKFRPSPYCPECTNLAKLP